MPAVMVMITVIAHPSPGTEHENVCRNEKKDNQDRSDPGKPCQRRAFRKVSKYVADDKHHAGHKQYSSQNEKTEEHISNFW